jgi:Threonine aldolase
MLSFECDYDNGAHPLVLQNLVRHNDARPTPYGFDQYSDRAKALIRQAIGMPDAQIFFLMGGTQTNATTIDSMLYQYEGVLCVGSGHINVHEAGAVEFTEHKIITLADTDGKLSAQTLDDYLDNYLHDGNRDHAVHPGLVYITFPTEFGTLYSASELTALYDVCCRYDIPLYIDGARLGYGLMSPESDVTLPFLARHCDVFYIGGTKIGALCGEAVVFTNRQAHKHFFSIQKQHGAVIAKGALIGLQFEALFSPVDDKGTPLYFQLSQHAITMAMRMKRLFQRCGFSFYVDSPTNQQFIILPNDVAERLSQSVRFTCFGQADHHHTICRFVTSWATTEEEMSQLEAVLSDK